MEEEEGEEGEEGEEEEEKAFRRNGARCRSQIRSPKRGSVIFYKVIEVAR